MPKRDRSRPRIVLPNWVRSSAKRAAPAEPKLPSKPEALTVGRFGALHRFARVTSSTPANRSVARAFRGICDPSILEHIAATRQRRHADPLDPFTLPTYRHPQARRRAREKRIHMPPFTYSDGVAYVPGDR